MIIGTFAAQSEDSSVVKFKETETSVKQIIDKLEDILQGFTIRKASGDKYKIIINSTEYEGGKAMELIKLFNLYWYTLSGQDVSIIYNEFFDDISMLSSISINADNIIKIDNSKQFKDYDIVHKFIDKIFLDKVNDGKSLVFKSNKKIWDAIYYQIKDQEFNQDFITGIRLISILIQIITMSQQIYDADDNGAFISIPQAGYSQIGVQYYNSIIPLEDEKVFVPFQYLQSSRGIAAMKMVKIPSSMLLKSIDVFDLKGEPAIDLRENNTYFYTDNYFQFKLLGNTYNVKEVIATNNTNLSLKSFNNKEQFEQELKKIMESSNFFFDLYRKFEKNIFEYAFSDKAVVLGIDAVSITILSNVIGPLIGATAYVPVIGAAIAQASAVYIGISYFMQSRDSGTRIVLDQKKAVDNNLFIKNYLNNESQQQSLSDSLQVFSRYVENLYGVTMSNRYSDSLEHIFKIQLFSNNEQEPIYIQSCNGFLFGLYDKKDKNYSLFGQISIHKRFSISENRYVHILSKTQLKEPIGITFDEMNRIRNSQFYEYINRMLDMPEDNQAQFFINLDALGILNDKIIFKKFDTNINQSYETYKYATMQLDISTTGSTNTYNTTQYPLPISDINNFFAEQQYSLDTDIQNKEIYQLYDSDTIMKYRSGMLKQFDKDKNKDVFYLDNSITQFPFMIYDEDGKMRIIQGN